MLFSSFKLICSTQLKQALHDVNVMIDSRPLMCCSKMHLYYHLLQYISECILALCQFLEPSCGIGQSSYCFITKPDRHLCLSHQQHCKSLWGCRIEGNSPDLKGHYMKAYGIDFIINPMVAYANIKQTTVLQSRKQRFMLSVVSNHNIITTQNSAGLSNKARQPQLKET